MTDKNTKKQLPGILRFLIMLFQIILYIPIQIIFIPFTLIGLIVAIYKEFGKSKKLGISFSAIKALQYRWFMHYFNTRPDPLSVAFIKKFPCESHFGLYSTFGALIISQRLFGFTTRFGKIDEPGKENMISTAARRVLIFDRIMKKYVDEMEQIVLPGAGFDLIALHFTKDKKVKVFELDQVNTLNVKVETLKKANIKHDWITYIPVDYSNESWVDKLLRAGFDKTKKTLFLWQSVSLFLEADIVKETLRKMADLCIDGSVIAQDFYSKAFSLGETSKIVKRQMSMIERMGEPWKFGIDMSNDPKAAVESFLKECGLKMTEYTLFGEKLDIEPFYCIFEAKKMNMSSNASSKSTILDHIDNISVPGDVFSDPANEYWALICLQKGLSFLNQQVAKCEENVKQKYNPSQIKIACFGNAPLLAGIPQDLLTCAFHWYAITACQYVRTVGTIAYQTNSEVNSYIRKVIPDVLSFRDKVAAHFAWTKIDSRDNKAERMISIMPQITFNDESFFVGSLKLTSRSGEKTTDSEAIKPWSVTKTHECLCKRYWPNKAF